MRTQATIQVTDLQRTAEGYFVSRSKIARTGIQVYTVRELKGASLFQDRDPNDEIRVYRPPDEVFAADSMESLAGKPITIDHPPEFVDSANAQRLVVGFVGDKIEREGDHVVGMVRVTHEAGVKAVEDGKIELSVGYDAQFVPESGTTPEGEPYDAVQRQIRANHVALVDNGRCGPSCRVHDGGDSTACDCQTRNPMAKTIDINGVSYEVPDQAAQAIVAERRLHDEEMEKKSKREQELEDKVKDLEEKLAKAETKGEDTEEKLKKAEDRLTPQALDAMVKDRQRVIDDAHKLAPDLDCSTLDTAAIKRKALEARGKDLEDKSEAYIDAAFEAHVELAEDADPGTTGRAADALAKARPTNDGWGKVEDARQKWIEDSKKAHLKRAGGE